MLFFRLSGTTTGAKEIGNLRNRYGPTERVRTINIMRDTDQEIIRMMTG